MRWWWRSHDTVRLIKINFAHHGFCLIAMCLLLATLRVLQVKVKWDDIVIARNEFEPRRLYHFPMEGILMPLVPPLLSFRTTLLFAPIVDMELPRLVFRQRLARNRLQGGFTPYQQFEGTKRDFVVQMLPSITACVQPFVLRP